jgi:hypothetical protein
VTVLYNVVRDNVETLHRAIDNGTLASTVAPAPAADEPGPDGAFSHGEVQRRARLGESLTLARSRIGPRPQATTATATTATATATTATATSDTLDPTMTPATLE